MPDILYFVGPEGEMNALNLRRTNGYGNNNPATKTVQYGLVREHAGEPGTFYLIDKSVWAPAKRGGSQSTPADHRSTSTPGQRSKMKSRETLEAEGAFPIDIPEGL